MNKKTSSPVELLTSFGASLWYDNIERKLLENGMIAEMIQRGEIRGITSNPSIFNNAIAKSSDYDSGLVPMAWAGSSAVQIYEQLAVEDIQTAADLFLPLYQKSQGYDGYVSLEVSPTLAYDTEGTIADAKRLWQWVKRPNLMIKIPATKQGLPAIRQAIAAGINVNVTLIFSRERYKEVMEMYLSGLEDRLMSNAEINSVASVASFFISRIDTKVDKLLEEIGSPKALALRGKLAVANAKLAYQDFKAVFNSERFERLKEKGARVQRPLWASTSTKNPNYKDTIYIDNLIGPCIVNTTPPPTLAAFLDHGKAELTIEKDLDEAKKVFEDIEALGISIAKVTQELEDEGVEAFKQAYHSLLTAVESRANQSRSQLGDLTSQVEEQVRHLKENKFVERMFAKDPTLWTQDQSAQDEVRNRLGWLDVSIDKNKEIIKEANQLLQELKAERFTHALLLGMGGSSLAAEVYRGLLDGENIEGLDLTILDSTNPNQVQEALKRSDVNKTLYIVSSKSGGTAEVNAFLAACWKLAEEQLKDKAGQHFIAITDKGTSLEGEARRRGFRKIFFADPSIGGRYSALIAFGLVPFILMGLDAEKLLKKTEWISRQCHPEIPYHRNPALLLGIILGTAALGGKDKLTFLFDRSIQSFGAWLEQLIAESSGKNGKGILPIDGEPLLAEEKYTFDRLFVYYRKDGELDEIVKSIHNHGHPILVYNIAQLYDLGAEFFRWEYATAVACSLLGVNAFDQPDVQDSKNRTKQAIQHYLEKGSLNEGEANFDDGKIRIYTPLKLINKEKLTYPLKDAISQFISLKNQGDYLAINAFLPRNEYVNNLLQKLRSFLQHMSCLPTTLGYGPRFLHSTGQLHKGGANNGLFLEITVDSDISLPIPDQKYTFNTLERAQALGDYEALCARNRRIMRIHFSSLDMLEKWITALIQ